LLVSEDGSIVALDSQTPGRGFRLDLSTEQLTPGGDRRELNPPLHSSPLLGVTNAGDSEAIRINGRGPALGRWETISAWALGHDGDSVFLATRFRVIRLASSAEQVWAAEPGPELWAINVAKDGRYVIAAAGDGTIRWFDAESGTQLLSIFVHADLRRWVAWAPDGHFTGSPDSFTLLRAFRAGETPLHLLSPIDQTTYEHDFHAADLLSYRFARPR
jgi:WD40 repeat protein